MKKQEYLLLKIAANVRAERSRLNISQEQLAELADLHRNYIGQIERAEKNLTVYSLYKISIALKVDITKLFE